MSYPKIKSVTTIDNCTLSVEFDNGVRKIYDVSHLLDSKMFAPLKNPALFNNVRVDQGGFAVVWNADIDISEYELWVNGTSSTDSSGIYRVYR